MDTSGVLVAAKDATTAGLVNAQFQAKQVSKAYLALCLGTPQQQQFTVDGPIGQHPGVQVARMVHPDGQPAVTHVQVRIAVVLCVACGVQHHPWLLPLITSSSRSNDTSPCVVAPGTDGFEQESRD